MNIKPRRSVVYVPGANTRALQKARELDCDAVIFDLEDSVAPDAKASARDQVVATLADGGFGRREVVVRVNAPATEWGKDDVAAITSTRPDAILVPKIDGPEDLGAVQDLMADEALPVWAMMETPRAMLRALNIADAARTVCPSLAALVMGTNDLAKDTRAELASGRAVMMGWLSACVAAARASGIDIIGGVWNDIDDAEGFIAECAQGRALGMDGKTLIHPRQIGPCNTAFSPDAVEVDWARKVIAAFADPANRGAGVLRVGGKMVEMLHADMARRTLALAEAASRSTAPPPL